MELAWLREWAPVISFVATLTLAGVAVWAVLKPIRENRRIRQDDRKRDFQERALGEIIEWAQGALTLTLEYPTAPSQRLERIFGSLQAIRVKLVSLAKIAGSFDEGLATQIENTRPLLDAFLRCVEQSLKVGFGQKWEMPSGIDSALNKLIEQASILKANLPLR